MRLIEVIHQRLMAERYQHRTPYKEVLKSISFPVGCYVDTGVSPSQFSADTRLDAYFQMLNSGDYDWFGTAVPSSSNGSVIYNINNLGASTIPYIRWGTFSPNTISYESGHSASDLNFSDAIHKVSMKGTEIRVDDVKVGTFGTTPSFVATEHIMLNNGRTTTASTKWQRFAISGLCDMIPVLDWNDRPCFYDRVRREFIYHSGTGTPTYERWNKLDVDYLQSDGSQYIQLNSTFDVTDEIEVKSRLIDINTDKFLVTPTTWNNNQNRFAMCGTQSTMRGVSFGNAGTPWTHYAPDILSNMTSVAVETYSDKVFTYEDNNGVTASYNANGITFGSATDTLKLFYGYDAKTAGALYYWKHKKNGELVEDLIPCVHNSKGAMYDQIENKMYYNANASASTGFKAFIEYDGVAYEVGDSIQTDGNSYIDTDILPTVDTKYYAEIYLPDTSNSILFGMRNRTSGGFTQALWIQSGKYRLDWNDLIATSSVPATSGWHIYELSKDAFIIDGTTVKSPIDTCEDGTQSSYLFAGAYGGDGQVYSVKAVAGTKTRKFKMSNGTELVRDFIPVKKSDGTIGMFDLVTRTLYTNSGSGAFSFNALSP